MILFDYKCPSCNAEKMNEWVKKYDDDVICNQCHSKMSKMVPTNIAVRVFPSDGVFLEHVSPQGKLFHSKSEMKKYAKDNDLELGYL